MKYFFITALIVSASAAPTAVPYVLHEKRQSDDLKWAPSDIKVDSRTVFPLSIGLTQRNLDKGHDYLMDVSDPNSPNYGKHWTPKEVAEIFAPAIEIVDAVKSWLASYGISEDRIAVSGGSNWIRFNSTVAEAESLLQTKYKESIPASPVYEHAETKKPHFACDEYSIPESLSGHIDFITPTIQFDAILRIAPNTKNSAALKQRATSLLPKVYNNNSIVAGSHLPFDPTKAPGKPDNGGNVKQGNTVPPNVSANPAAFTLANCNQYITPQCLRSLYGIPVGSLDNSKASLGIVEYTPQAYLQSDLNLFYKSVEPTIPQDTKPANTRLIDGAKVQTTNTGFNYNGESDLDLQYAIALVYPQKVTLYQVGDLVEGASFGNFLDAIDGSYCTFAGGDDPTVDSKYPDPNSGGYKGAEFCGNFAPTSVISTSYSYNEADLTPAYENRQCNEYMKLGLQGVTVIYSSGDYGVAGNGNQCCTYIDCAAGYLNAAGTGGAFNPSFPSTCPYVTSVGATQIVPSALITAPEEACQSVIHSGGGFSNVFPIPSYQNSAVASYFAHHNPGITNGYYNTGKTRGYPDISANGANFVVAANGALYLVFGTSAAAPTVGSIISLINEQRIKAKKSAVGFINPVLYANPTALNDITSGGNAGCGTSGFTAVPGWDPVTGLGTPNYPKLLSVFMALP